MVFIGIDPSFRKNGFAVCIIVNKEVNFKVFESFIDFTQWIETLKTSISSFFVVIENSNLQNATYDTKGSKLLVARKSRSVGKNQAASQYTVDYCTLFFGEKNVLGISPKQKGGKWTHETFMGVTRTENHKIKNYKGNKNEQDKRDAYQLALLGIRQKKFIT